MQKRSSDYLSFNVLSFAQTAAESNQNMLIRTAISFIENRLIMIKLNGPLKLRQLQWEIGKIRDENVEELKEKNNSEGNILE